MKRTLLKHFLLTLLIAFWLNSNGQSNCVNNNGNLETTDPIQIIDCTTPINHHPWINLYLDNWFVSHGTPEHKLILQPACNHYLYMKSTNGRSNEGVYHEFQFIPGQSYTLTFKLYWNQVADPSSFLKMQLSNQLNPAGSNPIDPLPTVLNPSNTNPTIADEPYRSLGLNNWRTVTRIFTVSQYSNFNQLCFYPYQAPNSTGAAEVFLDDVCITPNNSVCEPDLDFGIYFGGCGNLRFMNTSNMPNIPTFKTLETYWDFGDGTTGVGSSVNHKYSTPGTKNITMTLWQSDGTECCKAEKTRSYTINTICTIDFCSELTEMSLHTGWVIESGTSGTRKFELINSPDFLDQYLGYYWDFGDGKTGTGKIVKHKYDNPGHYNVVVTIMYLDDATGDCCSYQKNIRITI